MGWPQRMEREAMAKLHTERQEIGAKENDSVGKRERGSGGVGWEKRDATKQVLLVQTDGVHTRVSIKWLRVCCHCSKSVAVAVIFLQISNIH